MVKYYCGKGDMPMFKIVFFDLDGTLLNSKKEVLEENKKAIQNALDNGIEVCICTGRQKTAARHYQEMAGAGRTGCQQRPLLPFQP